MRIVTEAAMSRVLADTPGIPRLWRAAATPRRYLCCTCWTGPAGNALGLPLR